jgi:hypothetical protein
MKHIVLFSGGAASSCAAFFVTREHPDDTVLLHTPTYSEDADSDRFRSEVAAFIGLPITEQADGRDVWGLIEQYCALPSYFMPFCTETLKIAQMEKFIKRMDEDYTVYYGYTPDEWRRVQKVSARAEVAGRKVRFPIIERGISGEECQRIIREDWRICLPRAYRCLDHNNCVPCFKGGKRHFYNVWKHYPAEFRRVVQAEEYTGHTVFKDKSLAELAAEWQGGGKPRGLDETDNRPCMCAF